MTTIKAKKLARWATKADPKAVESRRHEGRPIDQRAMHRLKVAAQEWRRAHGLPV